jgi:hypothetical protein
VERAPGDATEICAGQLPSSTRGNKSEVRRQKAEVKNKNQARQDAAYERKNSHALNVDFLLLTSNL